MLTRHRILLNAYLQYQPVFSDHTHLGHKIYESQDHKRGPWRDHSINLVSGFVASQIFERNLQHALAVQRWISTTGSESAYP